MATIRCVQGDLFGTTASAVVLPVDGAARIFQGRTVGEFCKRYEDWPEVARKVEQGDPLPLGSVRAVPVRNFGAIEWVVLASTLAHGSDDTGLANLRAIVTSCVDRALRFAVTRRLPAIGSGLMQGGWRLKPVDAIHAIVAGFERARGDVDLQLHVIEPETAAMVEEVLGSLGFGD